MRRWRALAALALASTAHAQAPVVVGPPVVVDAFDSVAGWKAVPSDGVSLAIVSDRGASGGAMRLDFDFHGGGGYAVAHRAVSLDFPANYELSFDVRGVSPPENLEVKLIDASGDNVWWLDRVNYTFPTQWTRYVIKRRQISFAWGPKNGAELTHAAAIEIAITAGSGGKGSVWIDNLTLTPRAPVATHPPQPRATATTTAPGSDASSIVDANSRSVWRSGAVASDTLTLALGADREFGGLTVRWDSAARARDYDVQLSDDGRTWRTAYQLRGGAGARDDLYMPESESQWVRFVLDRSTGTGFAVRNVDIRPLAWSASLNAFDFAMARTAPRGDYPRAFTDSVQTYWTILGAPAAAREALMGEDGAVEVGKGMFSLEPFLYEGGRLYTWADVTTIQSLEGGDLPIPSVEWVLPRRSPVSLVTTAWVAGPGDSAVLYVRYRVVNRGATPRDVALFVGVRPFQVNGPFQFLNAPGGATAIHALEYSSSALRVSSAGEATLQRIVPLTAPAEFGAATFDGGTAMRSVRRGLVPPERMVYDSTGKVDGAFRYPLALPARSTAEVVLAVPFGRHAIVTLPERESASTIAARALERTRDEWAQRLRHVQLRLPDGAAWLARTLRSQIAYMLINQDGAALQPGSRAYERSWIRDGAMMSEALMRVGDTTDAARFAEWYLPYQYANGKVPCCVDSRGADPVPEHDSDGEMLFLVRELYRYTGDRARLEQMWPRVVSAVSYLDSLRHIERTPTNQTPATRQFYGLLPPSISHEGYSAKPMHSYWDDFWGVRGLQDAAAIADALGKPEAARIHAIADEFQRDVLATIPAAMQAHHIDYIPGAADLGDFDATSTTIALEPGGLEAALPQRALRSTFDRYWRSSLRRMRGDTAWKDYTPYELRTVGTFVRLDQPQRGLAMLDFFHEGVRPDAWNQWAEVVRRGVRTPGFIGDMPHSWVGSDFIRSLLDMFVYERRSDEALVIGAGIPARWAAATGGVSIDGVRTPYGALSVSEVTAGGTVHVTVRGLTTIPRGGIVVHAPSPMHPAHVRVNGAAAPLAADGSVTVRALPASIDFIR